MQQWWQVSAAAQQGEVSALQLSTNAGKEVDRTQVPFYNSSM